MNLRRRKDGARDACIKGVDVTAENDKVAWVDEAERDVLLPLMLSKVSRASLILADPTNSFEDRDQAFTTVWVLTPVTLRLERPTHRRWEFFREDNPSTGQIASMMRALQGDAEADVRRIEQRLTKASILAEDDIYHRPADRPHTTPTVEETELQAGLAAAYGVLAVVGRVRLRFGTMHRSDSELAAVA
jgi:hypothetical protein